MLHQKKHILRYVGKEARIQRLKNYHAWKNISNIVPENGPKKSPQKGKRETIVFQASRVSGALKLAKASETRPKRHQKQDRFIFQPWIFRGLC